MTVRIARYEKDVFPLPTLKSKREDKLLKQCIRLSLVLWEGTVDNEVACIWGLIPPTLMSNQAYLWLYVTPLVQEHQFLFIRHSQRVMEKMLEEYPTIVGHATMGSDRSIRWLKWLGAKFGSHNGKMVSFVIRKKDG